MLANPQGICSTPYQIQIAQSNATLTLVYTTKQTQVEDEIAHPSRFLVYAKNRAFLTMQCQHMPGGHLPYANKYHAMQFQTISMPVSNTRSTVKPAMPA